jgi:hypothetical protein
MESMVHPVFITMFISKISSASNNIGNSTTERCGEHVHEVLATPIVVVDRSRQGEVKLKQKTTKECASHQLPDVISIKNAQKEKSKMIVIRNKYIDKY